MRRIRTSAELQARFPIGSRARLSARGREYFPAMLKRSNGQGKVIGYSYEADLIRVQPDGYAAGVTYNAVYWEPASAEATNG